MSNFEITESELDTVSAAGHHHHKEHADSSSSAPAATPQGGPVYGYDLLQNKAT